MTRKLARLPRRAWSWWVGADLGVRVARWAGLATAAGYATAYAQWAAGGGAIAAGVGALGGVVIVVVLSWVAHLARLSEDRLRDAEDRAAGLQVVAQAHWDEQLRRAGKDRP